MPWVIISSSKIESTGTYTGFSIIQCKKMKWMYKETSVVDMLIMWVQNIPRPVQIYW